MKLGAAALITLALFSHRALALYDKRDDVVELTSKNFNAEVLDTEHLVSVEFFAPWCGHCKNLAPEYKKAAGNLKGLVKVAAIDCDDSSNQPLCSKYGVKGFPTIKVFKNKKAPSDYQGARTAKAIVDQLLSSMPSNVRSIKTSTKGKRDITLEDFYAIDNFTTVKSLLFTNKPSTPPLYKALSIDFKDSIVLGEVSKNEIDVLSAWGIEDFPTLVVIPAGVGEAVKYDGALKKDDLAAFMRRFVENKEKTTSTPEEEVKAKKEEFNPEPAQVKTQSDLASECPTAGRTHLCAIAVLPSIPASTDEADPVVTRARTDALEVLRTLKTKHRESQFRFMWVDEVAAEELVRKLDVSRDFPQMIAVEPKGKMWRTFVGAWDVGGVEGFLNGLKAGKLGLWQYEGDLTIVEEAPKIIKDEL